MNAVRCSLWRPKLGEVAKLRIVCWERLQNTPLRPVEATKVYPATTATKATACKFSRELVDVVASKRTELPIDGTAVSICATVKLHLGCAFWRAGNTFRVDTVEASQRAHLATNLVRFVRGMSRSIGYRAVGIGRRFPDRW